MQEPENFLKEEWEKIILAGVILLSVICLGGFFFRAAHKRDFRPDTATSKPYQLLFNKDVFSFLTQNQDIPLSRNPFQFHIQVATPEVNPTPPVTKTEDVKTAEAEPALEVLATPEEVVERAAEPVQPPVLRLLRKRLTYLYSQADNTGKTSAVIKISAAGGEEELHTPGTGDQVLGMTVLSIGAERLSLLDASGKQVNIPFGEAKTVVVRAKQ